jgi:hypothetical protein
MLPDRSEHTIDPAEALCQQIEASATYSVTARDKASKIIAVGEHHRTEGGPVEQHVKVLAILNIVLGGLGVLGALLVLVFFGGLAGVVGSDPEPGAHGGAAVLAIIGGIGSIIMLVFSIPCVIAGIGLLKFRSWAHVLGIVLSVLEIVNFAAFPISTGLGIYGLWVLLNKETKPLFSPQTGVV